MSSIQPTSTGKYEVRWREGSRNRGKTFKLKRDAEAFKRDVDREHERGRPVMLRGDVPTLHDFADEWFDGWVKRSGAARNTALFNATLIDKHIDPYLGHLPLVDLTARRLDEWQLEAMKAGTPYMVQRATQLLGKILDAAVRHDYIPGNPARSLEHIEHRHAEGVVATPVQVERIREWFLDRDRLGDATLVSLWAYCGPRSEEIFAMDWKNHHGNRHLIEAKNVDGQLVMKHPDDRKNGPRWIEIPDAVAQDLAAWRLAMGRPHGLIFPKPNGMPWTKSDRGNWRKRWFSKAAAAVGLEGMTPGHLRHTSVSLRVATGGTDPEIEQQHGHRIDTSRRIYQHPIEVLRGRRATLDQLIAEARSEVFPPAGSVRAIG